MKLKFKILFNLIKLLSFIFPIVAVATNSVTFGILSASFIAVATLISFLPKYSINKYLRWVYFTAALNNEYTATMTYNTFYADPKGSGLFVKSANQTKEVKWILEPKGKTIQLTQITESNTSYAELINIKLLDGNIIKLDFAFKSRGEGYQEGKVDASGIHVIKLNYKTRKVKTSQYFNNKPGHGTYKVHD